ncbi:MAG: NTP transferase domain-containing protein [Anaerolineales bacterium]|nr:NTP transferase domain-containing protein [Anaerolineales bacterium]
MPVVVLCGGRGMRMGGEGPAKKELVDIGGRPILWHVMKIYATYGHAQFILALGYQAESVKRYFLDYGPMSYDITIRLGQGHGITYHQANGEEDWDVTLADTGVDTEKGSRVYRVARHIEGDTFFVTYGEAVGDVNLEALLAFHRAHGRLATVTGVRPYSQYGIFDVEPSGQVRGFTEKPLLDHWINAGFMVFERRVLDYLEGEDVHLEGEALPRLAAEGQLMMYRHTGYWRSMKTFKDAQELDTIWRQSAPWKVW